jgi:hypothetical protein
VQVRWRTDLDEYLTRFVASHRGLRLRRLFGRAAIYAGRHLVSRACDDGLAVKLPVDAIDAARARGARPLIRSRRPVPGWAVFRPQTPAAFDALGTFLEIAARHVASGEGRLSR